MGFLFFAWLFGGRLLGYYVVITSRLPVCGVTLVADTTAAVFITASAKHT
jgi:hypothetical protein